MDIEIIKLPPENWEEYRDLRLKALKENPESFGEVYGEVALRPEEEWRSRLELALTGKEKWILFAKLKDELVGMVSGTAMESVEGGVKIREMFVVSKARNKGIATKLMQRLAEELLENSDKRTLRLGVFKIQKEAVNLYKSLGFEVLEEKTEHFSNGISHQSLIMEKKI